MSEKDYAPLSAACVRALHDKLYEKRKTAALEIEKMVKEFAAVNNTVQIKKLIRVCQDFTISSNSHVRKGGLIGLAAIAIALGRGTSLYIDDLVKPILGCFSDQDLRVRYYACESLYNIVKVARGDVLPHFAAIFNALSKIATDPEQTVKNGSELLDRLMKDIVTESTSFDLDSFMPLLRERIYAKSSFARQFVISWISVLDMVPDIDLVYNLPDLLDGLFRILDDPMIEVKKMCETTLGEFLRSIKNNPSRVDFAGMINILINHAQEKSDDLVQFTAITWIKEFVLQSGPAILPHLSGILTSVLPCLAYDTEARRNIKETAAVVNFTLSELIAKQLKTYETEDAQQSSGDDKVLAHNLDLKSVVDVLTQYVMHNSIHTKVAALKWIHDLYIKFPSRMADHIDLIFPALQRTLSDPADEVVQQCLVVIAEVIASHGAKSASESDVATKTSSGSSPYYNKFLISLLHCFSANKELLEDRGSFIIRQLCVLLNAEDIYYTLARILLEESNLKFARIMVQQLNMILLTSSELFEMRNKLKDLGTKESTALFCCLYKTWAHNPVATVALCLLSQNYRHVSDLIRLFGNLEITVDFLTEIDKLVQLIESPIFAYLRLELLEVPCDPDLVRSLYGLLMLLPQTEAFQTLRVRLQCIPSLHLHCDNSYVRKVKGPKKDIDFAQLFKHFVEIQEKHKAQKKETRAKTITNFDRDYVSGGGGSSSS